MTDTNSFPTSYFFANAPAGAPLSYQALVTRRKIAESLLGKRSPFPTSLGEGLTYAGERFADTIRMKDLDERERVEGERVARLMQANPLVGRTEQPSVTAPLTPTVAPPPVAPATAEPSPIPSHLIGARPVQTTREAPLVPPPAPDLPPSPGPRQQFGEAIPQAPNGSPDLPARNRIAAAMVPLPRLQPTDALPAPGAPDVPLPLPRPEEAPLPLRNALPDASSPAPELGVLQQQSGVRRMPLAAPLERQLQTAAAQAGLGVEVNSGGQPSYGPNRIGSHRHDAGAAADLRLFEQTEDGGKRYLSQNNPADRARMANFVRASVAAGATGVGSGPGYMGESGIHIGGGTPAVWGAGGRSANAPEWLRAAYQGGATGAPTRGPTPANNPPIVTAQIKQMPGSVAPFAPPGSNFFQPESIVGGSTGGASPTQIRPAPPAVLQAPTGVPIGGIPGPLSPPAPDRAPPSLGRVTTPVREKPLAPKPSGFSNEEIDGHRLLAVAGGNPMVKDHAEALIKIGQEKRHAEDARRNEQYKADVSQYEKLELQDEKFRREAPEREAALAKSEREAEDFKKRQRQFGLVDPKFLEANIQKSTEIVKGVPAAAFAINNARTNLENGQMFTGAGAEALLNLAKVKALAGAPPDPRIQHTENFKSMIAPLVAQARATLAGSNNISDADMRAAEKAAAGNISLEADSIKSVLNLLERLNVAMAIDHQNKVLSYTGNDPDTQRAMGGHFLPMERIVPESKVKLLVEQRDNPDVLRQFDEKYATPGLALKILRSKGHL